MNSEYSYSGEQISPGHAWIDPVMLKVVRRLAPARVLDLGCGNGVLAAKLAKFGYEVVGIDPSHSGIEEARKLYPSIDFRVGGVYDDPASLDLGDFDVVVSEEVVEHLYFPDALISFSDKVLRPGGKLVLSTPYYGYLRNLLLAICNRWDHHLTPLWDHGHIKLFSKKSMKKLLQRNDYEMLEFHGAGNCSYLWRAMVVVAARRPASP
jgi:2-polyprenyl-3-methyl-5-hydroxy-6-metoxy-1,4-benzoquinol methylase